MKTLWILFALTQALLAAPPCCTTNKVAAGKPTDKSLYQLETAWTTDFGKPLKLERLRGKPQFIMMFFASCEYACPVLVHDLRRIEQTLSPELREKAGFILVSFDTDRDTPEALHKYRKKLGLNEDSWVLLHGNADDVSELSLLLGVNFKKDARGQFAHSNIITLLNQEGEIVSQQVGLNKEPDEMVAQLKKLTGKN